MKLTEIDYDKFFDTCDSKCYVLSRGHDTMSFPSIDALRDFVSEFLTMFPSLADDDSYSISFLVSFKQSND